jgi:hypothetical protein
MKPHEIRSVGINVTNQVGANDALIFVRVVPAGRQGNRVLGRTLGLTEADTGEPVAFYPYRGEELHFPGGSIQITVRDLDRLAKPDEHGYAHLANIVWTWLYVGVPPDPAFFRFLLAAARRLDTAHALFVRILALMTERQESFIATRQRLFEALAFAETMCGALNRAIDMLYLIPQTFPVKVTVPAIVTSKREPLRQIRNAFEHIEDRAMGNEHRRPHPDALSIFDQSDFVSNGVLRYGSHFLDLKSEVPQMLVESRRALLEAAVATAGTSKSPNADITFNAAPPGSYERIQERAYHLWANRAGSRWWDPESNWYEAERADAQWFLTSGAASGAQGSM